MTAANFYAVLLGNASAVTGGSGKVLSSGPLDKVFVYYTDHGGPGVLGTYCVTSIVFCCKVIRSNNLLLTYIFFR